jgi:hypothetical protein
VHRERIATQHLDAIHADIADAALRVHGDDHRQRDVRAAILGPGGEDGELHHVDLATAPHDLLAGRRAFPVARRELRDLEESRDQSQLGDEALRHLEVHQPRYAAADVIEVVDAERHRHPAHGTEQVDGDGPGGACAVVADDVFEEEGRSAAGGFHHPIRYFAELEFRGDGVGYAREFACVINAAIRADEESDSRMDVR